MRYREKAEEAFVTLLSENFEKFFASADSRDISGQLDSYTQTPGWSGYKVCEGVNGAKLGTSTADGYLTTPALESAGGSVTVLLNAVKYKSENSSLVIKILSGNDDVVDTQTVSTLDGADKIITFSDVPETFSVQFATAGKKRLYLSKVGVYGGEVSLDDIASAGVKRFAPAAWTTVENIQATRYTATSLTPNATYEYQVQAVDADGNASAWTSTATVTLSAADAISEVTARDNQPAANGQIFDLSGRRVNGSGFKFQGSQLPKGVYIQNGKIVLIKE